jgi:hypothetical protein
MNAIDYVQSIDPSIPDHNSLEPGDADPEAPASSITPAPASTDAAAAGCGFAGKVDVFDEA